jgi:alcohol dehydrogenase class IV
MEFRKVAHLPLTYDLCTKIIKYSPSGSILFGNGIVAEIGKEVAELGAKKVLVVTDQGIIKAGLLPRVVAPLESAGIAVSVFDQCEPNPSVETVDEVAGLAKDVDLLVGFGGGSSMDVAKAAGILVTNGGKIQDYEGINLVKVPPVPMVAVPTTSGTGAESTPFSVVTDHARHWKMAIGSSYSIPSLAVCDPELTLTLPPGLTAATGMDALTHAIEGFTSLSNDPISESIALKAIELVAGSLRQAVAKGDANLDARYDMMLGSMMAGMVFTNTILGIGHSMAHPLGGMFNIAHGTANAILLPIIMEFNLPGNLDKFGKVAVAMGEKIDGLTITQAALKSVEAVKVLAQDIGIPRLSELGVKKSDVPALAEEAMKGGDRWTNPRNTTLADFVQLYKKALS